MSSFEAASAASEPSPASSSTKNILATDPCVKCDEMKTSVKTYDRHVIICLPHLALAPDEAIGMKWPSHVDEIPIVAHITGKLDTAKENNVTLKVTACDFNNYTADPDGGASRSDGANGWAGMSHISFIVYPEAVLVSVPTAVTPAGEGVPLSALDRLLAWAVQCGAPVSEMSRQLEDTGSGAAVSPVPWRKLILVCTHGNRDKRCGRAGPQVVTALQKELLELADEEERDSFRVCGSSHVGGHKFAGTLLVYPEADWFGRVSKSSAKALLQHIRRRAGGPEAASAEDVAVRTKCFRGNGFCATHSDHDW